MNSKEKITEILKAYTKKHNISASSVILEEYAEELIANGVIVPPCKVGDVVYVIMETSCRDIDGVYTVCEFYKTEFEDLCTAKGKCPYLYRIAECLVTEINLLSFTARWNKTIFLTKEEAEAKLKELK